MKSNVLQDDDFLTQIAYEQVYSLLMESVIILQNYDVSMCYDILKLAKDIAEKSIILQKQTNQEQNQETETVQSLLKSIKNDIKYEFNDRN